MDSIFDGVIFDSAIFDVGEVVEPPSTGGGGYFSNSFVTALAHQKRINARASITEDDDTLEMRVETKPGLRELQNKRASAALAMS